MRRLTLAILVFLSLLGCTTQRLHVLADSSCTLPCWNGIRVGATTRSELLGILAELDIVDESSVFWKDQPWQFFDGTVGFSLGPPSGKGDILFFSPDRVHGEARIIDERVTKLALCGDLGVRLEQAVAQMGAPTGVIALQNPYIGGIDVYAYNGEVGYELTFNTTHVPWRIASDVAPETPMECLILFDPRIYTAMLETKMISLSNYGAAQTLEITYPWAGYGKIQELYPPRGPTAN
jgi:hypothetical protein